MASILVTGGAGFIGSHLCKALLDKGHEVCCFDNLSTGSADNVKSLRANKAFTFVKGDTNTTQIDDVFAMRCKEKTKQPFDHVFHHAAVVGVRTTEENPVGVLSDIKGIMRILELCRKYDVKKAIFASSSEVYGHPVELPEREEGVLNPHIPYAATKLIGEHWFASYHKQYGLPTTSLRFFNTYGPLQRDTPYGFVVGIFIKQVLGGKQPTVFGDGSQTRDFMFIEDNINATIATLSSKKSDGESINIGTGKETTVLELAQKVIKAAGKEKTLKPALVTGRKLEIMRRQASTDKMKKMLVYTPKYTLDEGLKKTISWYKTTNRSGHDAGETR